MASGQVNVTSFWLSRVILTSTEAPNGRWFPSFLSRVRQDLPILQLFLPRKQLVTLAAARTNDPGVIVPLASDVRPLLVLARHYLTAH